MAIAEAPRLATRREPVAIPIRETLMHRVSRHWADYLYVLPALLVMLVVIGYPLIYTVWLSFHATPPRTGEWVFNGTQNYQDILSGPRFWRVTMNTIYWTVGSTLFAFILGFGAALALHNPFPGRGVVRALLLIPWVISAVAAAYVWRWILHSDYGLVSGMLKSWGVIDRPLVLLDSKSYVMPTLIAVNVWKEFPFVMVMLTAGLQTVPEGLLRAARIDGASTWNQFRHVTIPHLKGVILITTLLLFVGNLNSFTLVWLMTGGGPANASQLWITEIYNIAFRSLQYGMASAFSVILFIIMLALGYFYVKALTMNAPKAGGLGTMTNSRRGFSLLGLARWLFLAFLLAFTALPMVWMVSTSLKTEFAAIQQPPVLIPTEPTFAAVHDASFSGQPHGPAISRLPEKQHLGFHRNDRSRCARLPFPRPTPSRASASPGGTRSSSPCWCGTCSRSSFSSSRSLS